MHQWNEELDADTVTNLTDEEPGRGAYSFCQYDLFW